MSTIYTIKKNLENTIAGKEAYLAKWKNADLVTTADRSHRATIVGMLELNINELKVILHDVNKACEEYSLMGWQVNPERMGQ